MVASAGRPSLTTPAAEAMLPGMNTCPSRSGRAPALVLALLMAGAVCTLAPRANAEPGAVPAAYSEALALYRLRYDADALAAVRAYLAGSPPAVWGKRALFLRGVLERRTGAAAAAVETLGGLLAAPGGFEEHVRLELVRALHAASRPAEGLAALDELEKRHPGFEDERVALERARLLVLALPEDAPAAAVDRAIAAWEAVLRIRSKAIPKDEARYQLGLLHERAGDTEAARKQWWRLVVRLPHSPYAAEAAVRVPVASLSARERFDRAEKLFQKREYLLAQDTYRTLLSEKAYRHKAHLMIGALLSERLRQDYEVARDHFTEASKSKDKAVAGPALYKLGILHGKLGDHAKAVKVLASYRAKYKGDRSWSEAGFEIGRQHLDAGSYRKASKELAAWLASDKTVSDRSMYEWFIGWSLFRGGHFADAIKAFRSLARSGNTLVGDKALYWTAVAHDRLGERKAAVGTLQRLLKRFPFGYYSWLAERQLVAWGVDAALPSRDFSATAAWPADPWGTVTPTGKKARAALDRVRDLVEIGAVERARDVWRDVAGDVRADVGAAAMARLEDALDPVLERFRDRRRSREGAAGRVRSDYPTAENLGAWRDLFPKAWAPLVRVAAEKEGVPEDLVYSHMLQESRYNPRAVSNAPAFGVLQLLQRTARRICDETGVEYDPHDLYDPGTNIRLGVWYIGALIRRFHGQTPLAVASYNGGPRLLSFHMETHPGLDLETLIEDLATHQSRNYVRKVLEHFHRYLAIYETPEERREQMGALFPATLDYTTEVEPNY